MPPATAKPSIAAISGLRAARCAMPAKPRSPNHGGLALDERAEVHARGEEAAGAGEHADGQAVVAVELIERAGDALGERGVDGVAHLGPVERDQQDVAASLGEDGLQLDVCLMRRGSPARGPQQPSGRWSGREQLQLGLALAAQHREVDLDAVDPA